MLTSRFNKDIALLSSLLIKIQNTVPTALSNVAYNKNPPQQFYSEKIKSKKECKTVVNVFINLAYQADTVNEKNEILNSKQDSFKT